MTLTAHIDVGSATCTSVTPLRNGTHRLASRASSPTAMPCNVQRVPNRRYPRWFQTHFPPMYPPLLPSSQSLAPVSLERPQAAEAEPVLLCLCGQSLPGYNDRAFVASAPGTLSGGDPVVASPSTSPGQRREPRPVPVRTPAPESSAGPGRG